MYDCLMQFQQYCIQNNNIVIRLVETDLNKIYNNHFLPHSGHLLLSKNEISFFMYNVCASYITQPHLWVKTLY